MVFNTVHTNDFSFYEEIDEMIQEEPVEALDAERAGQLAAIGIESRAAVRPRRPDARDSRQAAQIGAGIARVVSLRARVTPMRRCTGRGRTRSSAATTSFCATARGYWTRGPQFHFFATVITPAMAHAQVGAGSAYAYTMQDATVTLLDGAKTYRLHVEPGPPAKDFWAVDVYDTQTRSLIQVPSTIWPALASNSGALQANDDGSYDLYFGPTAPDGKESNWVETIPGKSWFQLFRLYGPLEPWFDQTWTLNEFEPID